MLPVVASANAFNYQTPLVNTAIPGSTATRVPSDNVAPSLSSAVIDDNSRANTTIVQTNSQTQEVTVQTNEQSARQGAQFVLQQSGRLQQSSGVQSVFVAQLAAQSENSPETQGVLVQYERQIAISEVKYKPSDAFKPLPEPASVFGRILQGEKSAPVTVEPVQAQQAQATQASAVKSVQVAVEQAPAAGASVEAKPVARSKPLQALADAGQPVTQSTPTVSSTPNVNRVAAQGFAASAYATTASRVGSFDELSVEIA